MSWGLYSGAGAPGRPKTRRLRISHGLLGLASGPPQRAPPLWGTTAGDHELLVSPVTLVRPQKSIHPAQVPESECQYLTITFLPQLAWPPRALSLVQSDAWHYT